MTVEGSETKDTSLLQCFAGQFSQSQLPVAVTIQWTGLLDWTTGLDYWTGLLDWTTGLTETASGGERNKSILRFTPLYREAGLFSIAPRM